MTEIERKALELVNKLRADCAFDPVDILDRQTFEVAALYRAIERHEAFRQEVSDAIVKLGCWPDTVNLQRFIITKPDPLVEAVKDILDEDSLHEAEEFSEGIRAALAKRGLEIREKSK